MNHQQLDCLQKLVVEQSSSSRGDSIKGMTYYYRAPSIQEMYPDKQQAAALYFTGFSAKFINLSPNAILLFWDGLSADTKSLVGESKLKQLYNNLSCSNPWLIPCMLYLQFLPLNPS